MEDKAKKEGKKVDAKEPGTKQVEIAKAEVEKIAGEKAESVVAEKFKEGIPPEQLSGVVDQASKLVYDQLHPEVMTGLSAMNSRLGQMAESIQQGQTQMAEALEKNVTAVTVEECPNCGYKHAKVEGEVVDKPPEQPPVETPPPETPPPAQPAETPPVAEAVESVAQETAQQPTAEPPREEEAKVTYVGKCPQCNAYFDQDEKDQGFQKCPQCGAAIQWA